MPVMNDGKFYRFSPDWGNHFTTQGWTYAVHTSGRDVPPHVPQRFVENDTWWWEWDDNGYPIAWFNVEGSLLPGRQCRQEPVPWWNDPHRRF
jgi:hypothetical protein